jgi:hypothetical protein
VPLFLSAELAKICVNDFGERDCVVKLAFIEKTNGSVAGRFVVDVLQNKSLRRFLKNQNGKTGYQQALKDRTVEDLYASNKVSGR